LLIKSNIPGWWYTYHSEKYELVSWEDEIPNMWKVIELHGSKPPTSIVLYYSYNAISCYIHLYPISHILHVWYIYLVAYIWVIFGAKVSKYAIHGAYGYSLVMFQSPPTSYNAISKPPHIFHIHIHLYPIYTWVWVKIRYPNNWMVDTKLD